MKFAEIASRITGVSTPIFGVSWTPATADVTVAREVVTYLEDRRVLYAPYEVEVPDQVVRSVGDIRTYMTRVIGSGGISPELEGHIRSIRAGARKFMERWAVEDEGRVLYLARTDFGISHMRDAGFNQALGEFRGVVGVAVASMAASFGLDVEEPLSSVLPGQDIDRA